MRRDTEGCDKVKERLGPAAHQRFPRNEREKAMRFKITCLLGVFAISVMSHSSVRAQVSPPRDNRRPPTATQPTGQSQTGRQKPETKIDSSKVLATLPDLVIKDIKLYVDSGPNNHYPNGYQLLVANKGKADAGYFYVRLHGFNKYAKYPYAEEMRIEKVGGLAQGKEVWVI